MVQINSTDGCCGLHEISGLIPNPAAILKQVCEDRYASEDDAIEEYEQYEKGGEYDFGPPEKEQNVVFYVFTDVVGKKRKTNGEKLADYIIKHKLGTVTQTRARNNPKSGNNVKVFVWSANDSAMRAYRKKHG